MPSQIGSRMAFQNAANAVKRAGLNPGNAVLSQSYLRLEVNLSATATSYKFDVLVNESTNGTIATQQKLNLQDAFVVNQLGFFVGVPSSTTDTGWRLLTYPSVGNISGTAANFTAAQALTMYQPYMSGVMQLNVNQRTVLTAWDLYRHLFIPPTQSSAVTGTTAAPTAPIHLNDDNLNAADYGFYPCEPNIVLAGNKKNDLTVSFASSIGGTLPTVTRLVCIARGILAQNVTPIN